MNPIFLSVVIVLNDYTLEAEQFLCNTIDSLGAQFSDFEIIVVGDGQNFILSEKLKELTVVKGLKNLQTILLAKKVTAEVANWAGVEQSIGDFVLTLTPQENVEGVIQKLSKELSAGYETVAFKRKRAAGNGLYRLGLKVFEWIYGHLGDQKLGDHGTTDRCISRRLINYILQFPQPYLGYKYLILQSGMKNQFVESDNSYLPGYDEKGFWNGVSRGISLIVSSSRTPMRIATSICFLAAVLNIFYSIYVLIIWSYKEHVAEGWTSLSLQQSGMFFFISVVLMLLSEYILQITIVQNRGPAYLIEQEYASPNLGRLFRLNLEESLNQKMEKNRQ